MTTPDLSRLYGKKAADKIAQIHVLVIGLGGVGSWIAESLTRSGISKITLMDLDDVCGSNINRQVQALHSTIGQFKIEALSLRLLDINPKLQIQKIQSFFSEKNAHQILANHYDTIIDATDDFSAKLLLCRLAREKSFHLFTVGAAGGKSDPSQIRIADMTQTQNDKMLARIRKKLRQEFSFPRRGPFNIDCVYSNERSVYPTEDGCVSYEPSSEKAKLDCELGFGSASFVTGSFGFFTVAYLIKKWTNEV